MSAYGVSPRAHEAVQFLRRELLNLLDEAGEVPLTTRFLNEEGTVRLDGHRQENPGADVPPLFVPIILEQLKEDGLVRQSGQSWSLTSEGRMQAVRERHQGDPKVVPIR